ncbi:MAG: aminotransferase class V-fold PLP-dependent enzyme [Bacteroidales bacterium]|nr:aminotransferase class V-fold PLP-dependent enzyme [Bacteroidales bacterium]
MPKTNPFQLLESCVFAALETYSNVHRGSGLFSAISTELFDKSRKVFADFLKLNPEYHQVIFCSARGAKHIQKYFNCDEIQHINSNDFGLALGIHVIALPKKVLDAKVPFLTGGGTTRMVSQKSVIYANAPDLFEPGTPSIMNIIAFAKALQIIKIKGENPFVSLSQPIKSDGFADDSNSLSGRQLLNALRDSMIGRNLLIPTIYGYRPYTNLDYAASTPAFLPVWNAYRKAMFLNSLDSVDSLQNAISVCADFVGAEVEKYQVLFTANTTESINVVAQYFDNQWESTSDSVVVTTNLEHSSNDLPWRDIRNAELIHFGIDADGLLDLEKLKALFLAYNHNHDFGSKRIKLFCFSAASNVLGCYNNLQEISSIAHEFGISVMVDAAQLIAHRPIDLRILDFDFLAFSGHKVYAPFGTGVLIVKKEIIHNNFDYFSEINSKGSENLAGISALAKSLSLIQRIGFEPIIEDESKLIAKTLQGLSTILGLKVYGIQSISSPNIAVKGGVIPFDFKGKAPKKVANILSSHGIGVRYGCHCAHITVKKMLGIGNIIEKFQNFLLRTFSKLQLQGVLRVSFGIGTTPDDITLLINTLESIADNQAAKKISKNSPEMNQTLFDAQVKRFISERMKLS